MITFPLRLSLLLGLGTLAAAIVGLVLLGRKSRNETPESLPDRDLSFDPGTPNFVSSLVVNPDRRIEPLSYEGNSETAWEEAIEAVAGMPRTTVVTREEQYLHAETRSALFGFVDDIELLRNPGEKVIHLRSGSRVGHSDMGVNAERARKIRERFAGQAEDR